MAQRTFITIRTEKNNEEVDLEFPGDQRIGELMPDLLKVLNWPSTTDHMPLRYQLKTEQGGTLESQKSLIDQGIENFDVLWISLVEEPVARSGTGTLVDPAQKRDNPLVHGFESLVNSEPSPQDRRGTLTPPVWAQIPIVAPSLLHLEKGIIFELGKLPVVIGRRTRDNEPDIDISEIDISFLASRNHALIVLDQGVIAIKPQKTKNGTFLNNTVLNPEETYPLRNGDTIQFGFRGVLLIFRT